MSARCFMLAPTDRYRVTLQRFVSLDVRPCSAARDAGCSASVVIGDERHESAPVSGDPAHVAPRLVDDPRWPVCCDRCLTPFVADAGRMVHHHAVYTRSDGGPDTTIRDAPPGAMWDASWMPDSMKGPDGRCLTVRLPNGREWMIDGEASNCTKPGDRSHKCWVRHGEPPNITVDKNGTTCAAGAGSIASGDYHGFLRDGVFT